MVWLKLVHIAAIAIWCGGLLALPLMHARAGVLVSDRAVFAAQGAIRYMFAAVISPAAFIAIGSGTVLIFMRNTFEPWFTAKLVLVGILVGVHMMVGRTSVTMFEGETKPRVGRRLLVFTSVGVAVFGILFLVLGKPDPILDLRGITGEPGTLREIAAPLLRQLGLPVP